MTVHYMGFTIVGTMEEGHDEFVWRATMDSGFLGLLATGDEYVGATPH